MTVFTGPNAQGKTNVLEALHLCCLGKSHRTSRDEELIQWGRDSARVTVKTAQRDGTHEVAVVLSRTQRKKKTVRIGLRQAERIGELLGHVCGVLFSPEDLQLVKGEPALRRRFFDMQIAQTDPVYYDLLLKYNRVLLQRNRLLKELRDNGGSAEVLQPWNEEFIRLAAAIVRRRLAALAKLQAIAGEIYSSITQGSEMLQVRYEQKANNSELLYPQSAAQATEDFYRDRLLERQRIDILRGNTGIGPHRDDLQLLLNGLSLRSFGSQGQQRSGALALKLSQLQYVKNELGEFPVLLLDDVMSELDNSRRSQLLLFIDGRVQTFITVNDRELIPELAGNAYFKISGGCISEA